MFQRLRHIRQNGVLNLVFHGAEHSRFAHAMGVAWVAGKIFDAAFRNTRNRSLCMDRKQDREDTVLAALLHDVGHGPFSHTLEDILKSLSVKFDHEDMTKRILVEEGSEIATVLGERGRRLVPFIDKKQRDPSRWFYDIVSSALDADRLDYLLRDSTMAGVWSNRFDIGRLIDALGVKDDELVVDARARDVVESYLLAMEQMYASVYYHHTNRAASFLLRAVVARAVDVARADARQKNKLFPRRDGQDDPLWQTVEKGTAVPLSVYEALDENHVWSLISLWTSAADSILAELAKALKTRKLPKAVVFRKVMTLPPKALSKLEIKAKEFFARARPGVDSKYYIGEDKPERKAYTGGTHEEGYVGSIKLIHPDGRTEAIEETDRTIAKVLKDKAAYPSLIVPKVIRRDVLEELESMQ
ncbi:HD domain-containing protein [Polyangium spumosum]|uniref:HD domain-containing protein n=1 Tax=Polyangium spumosum TaxID=889282 RepID=A0A6N7Q0A6_9BACT|nr:HD domain-containing protein [Polyangium spumosum]MRG95724.1 HD domain-containing protein [Polyangium spumosum]